MQQQTTAEGRAWSQRWRRWLVTLGLGGSGRGVRVKRLDVSAGHIVATVQERSGRDHDVDIRLPLWSDDQWQHAVDALSSQAIYAAQLLAGDLPHDLDRTLESAGVQLLPTDLATMQFDCSCMIDNRKPCEHVAAVLSALGEMLPEDPWLLFRLRGRDQQGLLRSLRARNDDRPAANGGNGELRRSGFYRSGNAPVEPTADLNQELDGFWGNTKSLEDFRPHIVAPLVELALLRRLGVPPVDGAGDDTYDEMATLYRRISQETLNLAYALDTPENGNGDGADTPDTLVK